MPEAGPCRRSPYRAPIDLAGRVQDRGGHDGVHAHQAVPGVGPALRADPEGPLVGQQAVEHLPARPPVGGSATRRACGRLDPPARPRSSRSTRAGVEADQVHHRPGRPREELPRTRPRPAARPSPPGASGRAAPPPCPGRTAAYWSAGTANWPGAGAWLRGGPAAAGSARPTGGRTVRRPTINMAGSVTSTAAPGAASEPVPSRIGSFWLRLVSRTRPSAAGLDADVLAGDRVLVEPGDDQPAAPKSRTSANGPGSPTAWRPSRRSRSRRRCGPRRCCLVDPELPGGRHAGRALAVGGGYCRARVEVRWDYAGAPQAKRPALQLAHTPNCYAITTSNPFRPPLRPGTAACSLAPGRPRGRGVSHFRPAPMAVEKCRRSAVRPAADHPLVLLAFAPTPSPTGGPSFSPPSRSSSGCWKPSIHWLIDFGSARAWFGITTDQALHVGCKVLWCVLIAYGFRGKSTLIPPLVRSHGRSGRVGPAVRRRLCARTARTPRRGRQPLRWVGGGGA